MSPSIEQISRTDAGLASAMRVCIARLSRRLRSERDPANELSVGQLSVLGVLFRSGECTVGDLARHERVQPPSMTRTVNCLEEGGFVVRKSNASDGRQVLISLAPKGATTLATDRHRRDAWLAQQIGALTPDERSTLRKAAPILERLAQA